MDVDLVKGRNLIRGAEMEQVPRPTALRKVTSVLDERIQWFCELPIQDESGLSGRIPHIRLSWPVQGELPGGAPIVRELSRPRQL
jgi:hypothetical protein